MSKENLSTGFLTRSKTNQAVQPQKIVRSFKFQINEVEALYYPCSKIKLLISCTVTAQLTCTFVFRICKKQVSHDVVHIEDGITVKFLNFGMPEIFAVISLKSKQRGQTLRVFCQNGTNGIADSEDSDQTAPLFEN